MLTQLFLKRTVSIHCVYIYSVITLYLFGRSVCSHYVIKNTVCSDCIINEYSVLTLCVSNREKSAYTVCVRDYNVLTMCIWITLCSHCIWIIVCSHCLYLDYSVLTLGVLGSTV